MDAKIMKVSRRLFMSLLGATSVVMVGCGGIGASSGRGGDDDDDDGSGGGPDPGDGGTAQSPSGIQKVIWLQGAACTGCSVSFLNRIAAEAPQTAGDVLLELVVLGYHPTLMAAAGESAVEAAQAIMAEGGYLLVVEGGVPTAFGGAPCFAWSVQGQDVTFLEVVRQLSEKAAAIACVGNCASYGGIAAAGPNPAGVQSVAAATGKATVNVAGCPAHPDWIAWTVAQVVAGAAIPLDGRGRPVALYGACVHDRCPRREREEAGTFGVDGRCLEELGCLGPITWASCPDLLWNGGSNWCVDANAPCIGCTEPDFPRVGLMMGEVEGEEGEGDD